MQAKTAPARPSRGRIVRPNNWGVFLGREQGDLSFSASFEKLPGAFHHIGSGHSLFDGRWHRVAVTVRIVYSIILSLSTTRMLPRSDRSRGSGTPLCRLL